MDSHGLHTGVVHVETHGPGFGASQCIAERLGDQGGEHPVVVLAALGPDFSNEMWR